MTAWLLVPSAVALFAGTTLLLSRVRWFARPPIPERLRPSPRGHDDPASDPAVDGDQVLALLA